MNTPNYIRKAKVCPIKNQLYSPNTPNYVHEQMFAQLRMGITPPQKVALSGVVGVGEWVGRGCVYFTGMNVFAYFNL